MKKRPVVVSANCALSVTLHSSRARPPAMEARIPGSSKHVSERTNEELRDTATTLHAIFGLFIVYILSVQTPQFAAKVD
jgi:hypothetical protein